MQYNPDTSGKFKIVMNTYRVFGFWETLKEIILYVLSQKPHDDFDKKYGVMTSGVTESSEAGIADETARSLAVGYVPTCAEERVHFNFENIKLRIADLL